MNGSRQRISDGAVHLATEDDRPLSGVTRVDPVVDDGGDEDAGRERSRDAGPDGRPGEHFEGEGSARQLGEGLLGNVRQPRRALLFQRHVDHRQRPEIAEGDQRDAGRRRAETDRGSARDRSTQLGDTQRCEHRAFGLPTPAHLQDSGDEQAGVDRAVGDPLLRFELACAGRGVGRAPRLMHHRCARGAGKRHGQSPRSQAPASRRASSSGRPW